MIGIIPESTHLGFQDVHLADFTAFRASWRDHTLVLDTALPVPKFPKSRHWNSKFTPGHLIPESPNTIYQNPAPCPLSMSSAPLLRNYDLSKSKKIKNHESRTGFGTSVRTLLEYSRNSDISIHSVYLGIQSPSSDEMRSKFKPNFVWTGWIAASDLR